MSWDHAADFVVVGTGAAGATVALDLASKGHDVLMVEEGGWYKQADFQNHTWGAMKTMWRGFGAQLTSGKAHFPVVQGSCVGGSTVMNGAIVHRLPRSVWDAWVARDPMIAKGIPWEELDEAAKEIEGELQIRRNVETAIHDLPIGEALRRLGWPYEAMARNAPGCEHTGRCLLGCPTGGKWSLEKTFVPWAVQKGARVYSRCRVDKIIVQEGRARGVLALMQEADPTWVRIKANRAVIVAAGAVHTPLLLESAMDNPHVGRHFQTHVGSPVAGEYEGTREEVEGPAMGVEVLRTTDFKLATQTVPVEIMLARLPAEGPKLVDLLRRTDHLTFWTSSTRSDQEGRIVPSRFSSRPRIHYAPSRDDMSRVRRAAVEQAKLLFELGAKRVFPHIHGVPVIDSPDQIGEIASAKLDPRHYALSVTHIFGTARMSSHPDQGVVDPSFEAHGCPGLYVVDASVFPTNIGVNPQHAIMAMARIAGRRILA